MFALKSMQLRGTQLGGWDLSCQIPRKSTAVPNRASSEEMMIFGTGENVSASTASRAGNRVSVARDPPDKGDGRHGGRLRLTAHSRTVND
jgi:hypothetical protein